jgi:hypothetical protein
VSEHDGLRFDKRRITAMNKRRTKGSLIFWLSKGGLKAPRAYLGTSHELGALLHLMAEPRVDPVMENASSAERCGANCIQQASPSGAA